MKEIKDLFDESIAEQLFRFRKEFFEQKVYDNEQEIKDIESDVADVQKEMMDYVNQFLDEDERKEFYKLCMKVELTASKEIDFWSNRYYKLGLSDCSK